VPQYDLLERLADRSRRFVYLARRVDDAVAVQVNELALPGIGFIPESARRYPAGRLAAAILGHVGTDGYGLDGLEYLYDDMLTGKPGEIVVEQDQQGRDIPNTERHRVEARRGTDVMLTLDRDLQYEVESSLLDQVIATSAKGGMAVVVDVTNGDVLAMATVQGATATDAPRVAVAGERNRPLTDLFEPGSTNKLITLSTAIELGRVTPDTWFTVPDWISIDPELEPYHDAESHPIEQWTTSDILRESSNVGTILSPTRCETSASTNRPRSTSPDRRKVFCSTRRSTTQRGSHRAQSATASRSPRCRCSAPTSRSRTAARPFRRASSWRPSMPTGRASPRRQPRGVASSRPRPPSR
jgi:cell division protein FtsI (penicillin-binding protein 3)